MQLTESFAAAVQSGDGKNLSNSTFKDASVLIHQLHPEPAAGQVFKKGSVPVHGLGVSNKHLFAIQTDKAAVNIYSRDNGNQEAAIFFHARITSIALQDAETVNFAVLGLANGGLIIWEVSLASSFTAIESC